VNRPYIYIIAWKPEGEPMVFRKTVVEALNEESAYSKGQEWAAREKILPLPGPGNDFAFSATEFGLFRRKQP